MPAKGETKASTGKKEPGTWGAHWGGYILLRGQWWERGEQMGKM